MVEQVNVLCAGQTHVYRVGSLRCTCGAQANNPPMSGYTFPNYNPHHPRMQPPVAEPVIPASVKALARRSGASYISADGLTAYKWLFGKIYEADWLEDAFGVWWPVDDEIMPCGVVSVE